MKTPQGHFSRCLGDLHVIVIPVLLLRENIMKEKMEQASTAVSLVFVITGLLTFISET
mgnify:CR=1 FL=1